MPDIDWTIFNNIFTKDPSTSGVGNTTSTDTKPAGSNSSSSSSSGSESVSNSDISDAYGEALGILKDQGSIPENIPDTADNTKDAVTYFLYRLEAWIEANDEMVEYAEYIENQGRNYISNYLQTQKNPPFNVSAAFNEFLPVIKEQITEKQSISQSVKDKTTGLKENVEYNFELLMAAYAEAQGDNGYINSAEYAVVINMAVDYLMGVLLNGDYDNAFFAGIIPPKANGSGGYSINTDYKTAVSNIQKLANAQTPEDAQKYLNEVDAALRRFLGARNLGGSSKIGTAIENRQQQIFYEKCTKETGAVKDELCEAYADGSPKPEKEEVDKYVEFVNAIEAAFIAQYEGDGTNIKEEFSDYAQSVIKEHENVSAILKGLDVLEEKFGAYYNQLLEACKEDGELDNYLDETDRQEVIDQATGYVLSDIVRGNESGNMLVALGFSKDDRYKEVTSLLKGIENSVTPMDDYNKIRELITEMLTEAGANKIFALVEAQEELSNVDIDKNPALTDGLIENTIGEDIKVSLAYTIQGEKVVWADKEGKDDLNKVFTELEKRVQAAMKEHMGAAYDAKQVSEWFNYSIMAALNETSNVRTEVSISEFVQTVLAQFDSTSTMVLKGGDFESFAARELNMAKGIAESIAAEDAAKLQEEQNAKETASNAKTTAENAVKALETASEEIKKLKDELDKAIKENKSVSEIQQIAQKIKEKAQEANQLAIDARKAAVEAQGAAAAHQSSAEIQALAQEAEKLAAEANQIEAAINTAATEAQKSVDALVKMEEAQEAEAEKNLKYNSLIQPVVEDLVAAFTISSDSTEEIDAFKAIMEKAKIEFIKSYQGDEANIAKEFERYAKKIQTDSMAVNNKINHDTEHITDIFNDWDQAIGWGVEHGSLYADQARNLATTIDMVFALFEANAADSVLNLVIPNCSSHENYSQIKELLANIGTSLTPMEDYKKAKALVEEMVDSVGILKIGAHYKANNIILSGSDVTKGVHGYKSNDTYGGEENGVLLPQDNLVNVSFKLDNNKVVWTNDPDAKDLNITFTELRANVKAELKSKLGAKYNESDIEKLFDKAMCEMAKKLTNFKECHKVEDVVDSFLREFDSLMNRYIWKDLYELSPEVDLRHTLDLTGVKGYQNQDTYGGEENGKQLPDDDLVNPSYKLENGKVVWTSTAKDSDELKEAFDTIKTKIHETLKTKLGDKYDQNLIDSYFESALVDTLRYLSANPQLLASTDCYHMYTIVDTFLEKFDYIINTKF